MTLLPHDHYRNSSANRSPLRIGLLLDSPREVPAFVKLVIEDIKASNFARIELVVTRAAQAEPGRPTTPLRKILRRLSNSDLRKRALYDLYLQLDARMKPANDPLANINCVELLSGIEMAEVDLQKVGDAHHFSPEAVEKIRSKNLDVILQFTLDSLAGEFLKVARYGVWSFQHHDPEFYCGGPPHFWELLEDSPLSGVALKVLSDEPGRGPVLCKSLFATERTLSVSRNRCVPYWGSTEMIIRKLYELHYCGWDHLMEKAVPPAVYRGKRQVSDTPKNVDMLPWLGPILLKKAASYPFRNEKVAHWRIAIRANARPLYDAASDSDLSGFRWIDPPQGRAWADPFVFEHEGKCWAFFEDYSYEHKRARIACAEISEGELGQVTTCLDHPSQHYSYPHIFRAESEIFMIPESFDSNSVDLYRCQKFPNQWIREATLLRGKFVDTTVWEHAGLWWMATTSADPVPGAGSLLLYFAESLTGDWQFHRANPISADIRTNRGAGRIIQSQNRLIRPSQSCAPTYGYSITFNEITELSEQRYSERPIRTIGPNHWKGLTGVHTYNCAGGFEFIDGQTPMPLRRLLPPKR